MDFQFTPQQDLLRKSVREFAEGAIGPKVPHMEETDEVPWDLYKEMAKQQYLGILIPKEFGGTAFGNLARMIMLEEVGRVSAAMAMALQIFHLGTVPIVDFGNEVQKKKYLIPLTRGEAISAGGFTEPDHGSDITRVRTTAVKDGDGYRIDGVKTFISNGTLANFVIVLCQTDSRIKPSYRGMSTLLVEKGSKGFEVSELGEKMGIKMTSTTEMSFDQVRVPAENLVGELHKGFYQVIEFFDESRVMVAAQALGIAQGAFDRALDYAKKREQFGQRLVEFQVTQHKLADMATQIEAARCLVYKAGWNFDQGRIEPKWTSMAKMYAGRVAVEVAQEAIQIHGGYGYMLEYEVERYYRDARITEIYEGTREIQKNTIANTVIGKKG